MDQKRRHIILRTRLTQILDQTFDTPVDLWGRIQADLLPQQSSPSRPWSSFLPTRLQALVARDQDISEQGESVSRLLRPLSQSHGLSVMVMAALVLAVFIGMMIIINQGSDPMSAASPAVPSAFEYGGHVTDTGAERAIAAMRQAEMSWMKITLDHTSESSDAVQEISIAHANGFKLLISAIGEAEKLSAEGDAYRQAYAEWVGQMAAAGADAIEVWNEPNIDRNWPTGQVNGANYVPLLRLAYERIKSANSNTLVISAAPAPTGAESVFPTQVRNDDAWLRDVVHAGGLQYMDCVGIHYNEGIVPPDATSGDPRDNYYTRYFPSMINMYWNLVVGQKPLCFTEIGYLSAEGLGPLPEFFAWASDNMLAEQAAWLVQAVTIAEESGKVRLMLVWNIDFKTVSNDPQGGFAIVRPDDQCLACQALGDKP